MKLLALSAFCLSLGALAQPVLQEVPVAEKLQEDVVNAYEYSRGHKDIGGISSVQVYKLNGSALEGIEALIENSPSDTALSKFCYANGRSLANKCADLILSSQRTPGFSQYVDVLSERLDNVAVTGILSDVTRYVLGYAGNGATEYSTSAEYMNGELKSSLFISADGKTLVYVAYDYGA